MATHVPAAVYGLEVPAGDNRVPANAGFPATLRVTMAAIDPTAEPEGDASPPRATLKLIRRPLSEMLEDDDEDSEDEAMAALLNGDADELDSGSSDDDDDEEVNGGPSDPSKSKRARKEAAAKEALQALKDEDANDMEVDGIGAHATKKSKGKSKILDEDDLDESESSVDPREVETFVICTLDPVQHFQQPLDITIGEKEKVYFQALGTHSIFLTGNYIMVDDDSDDPDYNDMGAEYDLSPHEDEIDYDEESDELDDIDDPRITELGTDEEKTPKLVAAKGTKKRPASDSEDELTGLDEMISKAATELKEPTTNGEAKLSKKQRKKLKNQAGQAVPAAETAPNASKAGSESGSNGSKKVQFAKNLEQGPTPKKEASEMVEKKSASKAPAADKGPSGSVKQDSKQKPGVRTVNGVIVDDRKVGEGPKAKKGSRLELRYIGKLKDGKVFDANKKGKPFSIKLGAGEVIKGWDIGLEGIMPGGERKLTIPAHMAYGNQAKPGIPANSQLTFDVKCLAIQ